MLKKPPSVLVLDPRVRWEPIGHTSARLIVPFGEHKESLRVEFDPETGLMKRMSGIRYRDQEEMKTPWHGEYAEWRTVHGIKVPHRVVGAWEDWEKPYAILDLEGVEYNVDVSGKIPDAGPTQDIAYARDGREPGKRQQKTSGEDPLRGQQE